MKIAKGRMILDEDDFARIFNIPNDVSIINVKIDEYGGIEFIVASPEPVSGFTHHVDANSGYSMNNYRAKRLNAVTVINFQPTDAAQRGGSVVD